MQVRVVYDEFKTGKVQDFILDSLIKQGKIMGFFRSYGYVRIGHDTVRGAGGTYAGPERRHPALQGDSY